MTALNLQLSHRYLVETHNVIMEIYILELTDTCVKFKNLISETIFWQTYESFSSNYNVIENLGWHSIYVGTYTPDIRTQPFYDFPFDLTTNTGTEISNVDETTIISTNNSNLVVN